MFVARFRRGIRCGRIDGRREHPGYWPDGAPGAHPLHDGRDDRGRARLAAGSPRPRRRSAVSDRIVVRPASPHAGLAAYRDRRGVRARRAGRPLSPALSAPAGDGRDRPPHRALQPPRTHPGYGPVRPRCQRRRPVRGRAVARTPAAHGQASRGTRQRPAANRRSRTRPLGAPRGRRTYDDGGARLLLRSAWRFDDRCVPPAYGVRCRPCAHRRMGNAAALHGPGADLPDRRRQSRCRHLLGARGKRDRGPGDGWQRPGNAPVHRARSRAGDDRPRRTDDRRHGVRQGAPVHLDASRRRRGKPEGRRGGARQLAVLGHPRQSAGNPLLGRARPRRQWCDGTHLRD